MQRTWTVQLIGILIILLLLVYTIPLYTQMIPNSIADQVQQYLHNKGLTWTKVEANDRNIVISGSTSDIKEHQQAVQMSRSLWYVKQVEDAIQPPIVEPYTMNIQWNGESLTVKGYVSGDEQKAHLAQQLVSEYNNNSIQNDVQTGAGAPEDWDQLSETLLNEIKTLKLASVQMIGQTIRIAGKASTTKEVQALKQAIEPFQQQGYTFSTPIVALDNAAIVCQKEFNRLLSQEKIRFESGGSSIDSNSDSLLGELADAAIFCADSTIVITGHTDNIGNDEDNLKLSEQRAKAVKGWLFNEGGVPLERLKTQGKGASERLETNETTKGRAKNRRIEFIVEGI